MYRAVTLCALEGGADLDDEQCLEELTRNCHIELRQQGDTVGVSVNGREVTAEIRSEAVTAASHKIAGMGAVRELLVAQQRQIAAKAGALVTEGRDQGTVVFADARWKFYLDASAECRARRRCDQLRQKGVEANYDEVLAAQRQRDGRDTSRQASPLKKADDAIVIDTTDMSVEEVVERLMEYIKDR